MTRLVLSGPTEPAETRASFTGGVHMTERSTSGLWRLLAPAPAAMTPPAPKSSPSGVNRTGVQNRQLPQEPNAKAEMLFQLAAAE